MTDYGYKLASEYWPGLDREDFDTLANGSLLALHEWDDMVGPNAEAAAQHDELRLAHFHEEAFGGALSMLMVTEPPGVWSPDHVKARMCLDYLKAAGVGSVLDYGGGIGAIILFLARWGLTCGLVEIGQQLRIASWLIGREGRRPIWEPAPGTVSVYDELSVALGVTPWDAIMALDVFEHLVRPLDALRIMTDGLRPGGLFLSTPGSFFRYPGHLDSNLGLFGTGPGEGFYHVMEEEGFELLPVPHEPRGIVGWRKPA